MGHAIMQRTLMMVQIKLQTWLLEMSGFLKPKRRVFLLKKVNDILYVDVET